jgi:hypothetical protein
VCFYLFNAFFLKTTYLRCVCGGGGGGWGRGVDSAAIPTEDALKRVGRGEHEVDACGRLFFNQRE